MICEDCNNSLCPILSLEKKNILKISENSNVVFTISASSTISPNVDASLVWYSLEPMGIKYLGSVMSKLIKAVGLSNRCIKHSIRSTAVTILTNVVLETLAKVS